MPGEWGSQHLLRQARRRAEDQHQLAQAALRMEEDMMHAYMRYCNAEPRSEAG